MFRQSVPLVALACVLAACGSTTDNSSGQPSIEASASPSPTVTVLDEEAAGKRYLSIICPANASLDQFDILDENAYLGSTMTTEYRKGIKKLAAVFKRAARQLVDSDYEWPERVSPSIERVAEEYYGESASLTDAAKEDVVTSIDWHTSRKFSNRVRLRLGLPPAGAGCKKYVG